MYRQGSPGSFGAKRFRPPLTAPRLHGPTAIVSTDPPPGSTSAVPPASLRAPEACLPESRRAILREVTLVFALSIAGCLAFIGLGYVVPFVRTNLHAFVALLFLLLPAWALRRRNEGLEDYGLHLRGARRALLVCGIVALVTFPPYVVGHHLYQTEIFHRPLHFAWTNYSAFPDDCQGAPGSRGKLPPPPPGETPPVLTLFCERDEVHLRWRSPIEIDARGRGLSPGAGSASATLSQGAGVITIVGNSAGAASVRVPPGSAAEISPRRGGAMLGASAIEIGPRAARPSEVPVLEGRSLWWLIELVLAQLIAVALPEEVFYRGYLQGRLLAAFPRRRRFFGTEISMAAIFWTSVFFALGHFLLDFNPQRLAVFFPSLAFGWIRARTPTLAGCIVFHAFCNVLVRLLILHY